MPLPHQRGFKVMARVGRLLQEVVVIAPELDRDGVEAAVAAAVEESSTRRHRKRRSRSCEAS